MEDEDDLKESLDQLQETSPVFQKSVVTFLQSLPAYITLDEGRLVVCHVGLPEEYHGQASPEALRFAVYGRRVLDENGIEVRYRWARDYRGAPLVVYGHYSQEHPDWQNGTVCLDTGCVYGGRLTALRYPERELVSVVAARIYRESRRSEQIRAAALASEVL